MLRALPTHKSSHRLAPPAHCNGRFSIRIQVVTPERQEKTRPVAPHATFVAPLVVLSALPNHKSSMASTILPVKSSHESSRAPDKPLDNASIFALLRNCRQIHASGSKAAIVPSTATQLTLQYPAWFTTRQPSDRLTPSKRTAAIITLYPPRRPSVTFGESRRLPLHTHSLPPEPFADTSTLSRSRQSRQGLVIPNVPRKHFSIPILQHFRAPEPLYR